MKDGEKIKAILIIEILGRPAEHIKKALEDLIKKLCSEKGIKVIESKIHEPKLVKDSKDIYTTFAEVSIEFDSILNYFGIIFAYMPANIEIISPEKFQISNADFNDFGNKLLLRLHDYDAIVKKALYERDFLTKKLFEVAPHLFKQREDENEVNFKPKEKIENKKETKKEKKSKK